MKIALYGNSVTTICEKQIIEGKCSNEQKMEYLIDILIASLKSHSRIKYMGFLAAMETSPDILLQEKARQLSISK